MTSIAIKNLDLFYGGFQALKAVELFLPEKQISAFIGPSGCGKSTLLKSINRMNDLVANCRIVGDVYLDERSVYQTGVDELRKKVGMVFQKANTFPMSI